MYVTLQPNQILKIGYFFNTCTIYYNFETYEVYSFEGCTLSIIHRDFEIVIHSKLRSVDRQLWRLTTKLEVLGSIPSNTKISRCMFNSQVHIACKKGYLG